MHFQTKWVGRSLKNSAFKTETLLQLDVALSYNLISSAHTPSCPDSISLSLLLSKSKLFSASWILGVHRALPLQNWLLKEDVEAFCILEDCHQQFHQKVCTTLGQLYTCLTSGQGIWTLQLVHCVSLLFTKLGTLRVAAAADIT